MNPHTSTPSRASIPSRIPQLVPTQMRLRRPLFFTANAGYESSGGGSSEGGFITAGVESTIGPSGRLRTAVMTLLASVTLRFISGASAAALATVNGTTVPSASAV